MGTFTVTVCRIGYGFKDIQVEADSQQEADEKALDEACNHEYSEKNAEYVLEGSLSPSDNIRIAAMELIKTLERSGLDSELEDQIAEVRKYCSQ
jgi:hypothetical protein